MELHLLEAVSDGVATLTLNRPERLNALSTPMAAHRARNTASIGEPAMSAPFSPLNPCL
jgi:hypothetical protein